MTAIIIPFPEKNPMSLTTPPQMTPRAWGLTTRELVAIRLARETALSPDSIVAIVKRLHATAGIIRDAAGTAFPVENAISRAQQELSGTGWEFDASNTMQPAIQKGQDRIVIC
jgi:hypothetical protein